MAQIVSLSRRCQYSLGKRPCQVEAVGELTSVTGERLGYYCQDHSERLLKAMNMMERNGTLAATVMPVAVKEEMALPEEEESTEE